MGPRNVIRPTKPAALVVYFSAVFGGVCSNEGQSQTTRGRGNVVTPVAVTVAGTQELARRVTLTGPVEPIRVVSVNSRTAGSIVTVGAIALAVVGGLMVSTFLTLIVIPAVYLSVTQASERLRVFITGIPSPQISTAVNQSTAKTVTH